MPTTARKLPSGSYTCRVWDRNLQKQVYFTDKKKSEAERKAALYQIHLDALERSDLTFEQAAGQFFANRTKAFSEDTIREYKRIYEEYLTSLYPYKVDAITNEELQALANTLTIELALYGGLRRGEFCALEVSDLTDNTIHIVRAMVQNEDGLWVIKAPKTAQSDRYVELPPALVSVISA